MRIASTVTLVSLCIVSWSAGASAQGSKTIDSSQALGALGAKMNSGAEAQSASSASASSSASARDQLGAPSARVKALAKAANTSNQAALGNATASQGTAESKTNDKPSAAGASGKLSVVATSMSAQSPTGSSMQGLNTSSIAKDRLRSVASQAKPRALGE